MLKFKTGDLVTLSSDYDPMSDEVLERLFEVQAVGVVEEVFEGNDDDSPYLVVGFQNPDEEHDHAYVLSDFELDLVPIQLLADQENRQPLVAPSGFLRTGSKVEIRSSVLGYIQATVIGFHTFRDRILVMDHTGTLHELAKHEVYRL